jgi:hypothetical protein
MPTESRQAVEVGADHRVLFQTVVSELPPVPRWVTTRT